MAVFDLKQCDKACLSCVKGYKAKHDKESKFSILCTGIPTEYVPESMLSTLSEEDAKSALSMLDPVTWAAEILDWHCIDEDGAIWKRKSAANTLPQGCPNYYSDVVASEARIADLKSPFHRPYQAEMLRCTSKRKVFRIGRQAGKTETLIIAVLHAMYTNKNFKVVLIAPFQNQIELIFSRIEEHLAASQILANAKKRMVKAPSYSLILHNGSFIRAFTAGTQSRSNAGSARGQSAHMLVFDEADYLADGDISATLAMILNFPEATVWMSSTPTGKRERFYQTCHSPLYREFFYPSYVSPSWNENSESFFRNQYDEISYKHEILADFGEQREGVFQVGYVNSAKKDYSYSQMMKTGGWQYCIGVDWNDRAIGTTIVVTGYNPGEMKFYVVDRQTVSIEGWTQLGACEKIAQMNRQWMPEWIYIDKGYGSTQYEVLRDYGYTRMQQAGPMHVDSRLAQIVKQYDFGSQLEVFDPFTKQPVKKSAKPFLVENAVRRFETHSLYFPQNDAQLEAELLGYIIDRVTQTGVPVFKQGNAKVGDHNLDALMLSLVPFTLEMTKLGKPRFMSQIAFSGQFGVKTEPQTPGIFVKPDEKHEANKARTERLPDHGRNSTLGSAEPTLIERPADKMPGAHLQNDKPGVDGQRNLWDWPGFSHDQPRPKPELVKIPLSKLAKPGKRNKF